MDGTEEETGATPATTTSNDNEAFADDESKIDKEIADLKVLRSLMISTIYHDSVTAYATMKKYRTTTYAMNNSGWTLLDAAEQMFCLSRARVFNKDDGKMDYVLVVVVVERLLYGK